MSRLSQGLSRLNSQSKPSLSLATGQLMGGAGGGNKSFEDLKRHIHAKLVEKLDFTRVKDLQSDALRKDIRRVIEHLCDTENPLLNRIERERPIDELLDETLGFGPLEALLKDPTIPDILINRPHNIFVERRGKREKTDINFRDNEHM